MLNAIYIKKYRKIEELELFFNEGLNILIGENNGGKTTILKLIDSFLNNDTKIFKDILEADPKPNISFNFKNEIWILNTKGKTWKWENSDNVKIKHEKIFHGFISAHPKIEEINNSMKSLFINRMEKNEKLCELVDVEKKLFSEELNSIISETRTIKEDDDDYSFSIDLDWTKAFAFNFDFNKPKNIANKGLGQQKEFIINNYSAFKNNTNIYDYLIIDEIENSLSLNSLIKIINEIADNDEKNKQYFISSHSPEMLKLVEKKKVYVTNVGNKIPNISTLPKDFILCEGKSDFNKLKKIWPKKLILPGGGSNINYMAQAINNYDETILIKIIVDGDEAGNDYFKKISKLENKQIKIHKLSKGTIEDYIEEAEKISILNKNGITDISSPVDNNILRIIKDKLLSRSLAKDDRDKKISKIKTDLQQCKLDIKCLIDELKDFIDK